MGLGHAVLEQAVNDDHVGADELAAAGDLVFHEGAVVHRELELEVGCAAARLATTARGQRHRAATAGECQVRRFERPEHGGTADPVALGGHAEHGVALQLGHCQRGTPHL